MYLEAIHANVTTVQIDQEKAREIGSAEFSPCGRLLLLLNKRGVPEVLSVNGGNLESCRLNYNIMRTTHGFFHPHVAEIALTSRDENLVQRFFVGLPEMPAARHPAKRPLCAAYSPETFNAACNMTVPAKLLIIGTESGAIKVWDLQNDPQPVVIWDETIAEGPITSVGLSTHNDMFYGIVQSKGPFLFDTYGQFSWLPNEDSWGNNDWNCNAVVCHPQYNFFAYAGRGPVAHTYDWRTSKHSCMVTGLPYIKQIKFAGSDQIVFVGESSLEVWYAKGYARICRWDAPVGTSILAVHPEEMHLSVACG